MLIILSVIAIIVAIAIWLQRQEPKLENQEIEIEIIDNKTVNLPKDIKTYTKHPYAPDFGDFTGMLLEKSIESSKNTTMYIYKAQLYPDKNVSDYMDLITEELGYTYGGKSGEEYWYYHKNYRTKITIFYGEGNHTICVSN